MEKHFHCTACGKCCSGWLPLTLDDALTHAGRFPLAMILTTVRQSARAYKVTARNGTVLHLSKKKRVAVQISPTSYIPPAFSCPELTDDGGCAIHAHKPVRCRAMPFSAYRDESDQGPLLNPRDGWLCDTSSAAPPVYRDKQVLERQDFDLEARRLKEQASILRPYADALISAAPNVAVALESASKKAQGGTVVLNFTTILPRLKDVDTASFAKQQLPVLRAFAKKTAGDKKLADYHQYYAQNIKGLERF
ncbi:MAG: YkgJ family cysteine cluster protein [Rhodospirillaceae bacterium]|nr:YkgJ family cysteine cluster protein [Rhodospirillaceae bacterium]